MGFGSGSPTSHGNDYRAIPHSKNAVEVSRPGYVNTEEIKVAKYLIRMGNTVSFNYRAFAYHFVMHAPGPVIENVMRMFDSILDVLVERIDNDLCDDRGEYNSAITAKRIQEALEKYK